MNHCVLVLNHAILPEQVRELEHTFGIERIENLPSELLHIWNRIKPSGALDTSALQRIIGWIADTTESGDYIVVQGEFGATYYVVSYCLDSGLIPLYATSERVYAETKNRDGSITRNHIFRHVCFRKYEAWRGNDHRTMARNKETL